MASRFANKVILITGASSGIGLASARLFSQMGGRVVLTGRNKSALEKLEAELKTDSLVVVGDVTSEKDVENVVEQAVQKFEQIDVLVNAAGILKGGAVQDTSVETFDANFNTNVKGSFLFMKNAIPHLKISKGCIVNVSSVNGMQSFGGVMAYCASKAAVDHMTRCSAVDLAPFDIRCNAVNPGVTRTELQLRGGLSDDQYAGFLERSKVTHPLGRIAEPEEVASVIAFLADNTQSSFVTGAILPVDGGRACLGAR